ncbi:MAG: hypothetical protein LAT63_13025 [Marinobacter sp.]|nr:hypothetical protein [Marinobacter sp.]
MEQLVLNSDSIFHLHQLASHYRKRGGPHFHLAIETERLELIRQTSVSPDPQVQKYFRKLWLHLAPDVVDALVARGGIREPGHSSREPLAS